MGNIDCMINSNIANRDLSGIGDFIRDDVPVTTLNKSPVKLQAERDDISNADLSRVMDEPASNFKKRATFAESDKNLQGTGLFGKKPPQPAMTTGKLAYGSKKRINHGGDGEDYEVVDRVHGLQKENLVLKEKENLLEREILKMQTKLRRIEELQDALKKKRAYSDKDIGLMMQDLQEQLGEFKDENALLKERVRKLKIIQKGLGQEDFRKSKADGSKTRPKTASNKFSRTGGSKTRTNYSPSKHTPESVQLVEDLKLQLVKNEKEILKLNTEKQRYAQMSSGQMTTDDLLRKIREREAEIRDITRQYEEIEQSFIKRESIFKDSKQYMQSILQEIGEAKINNQALMIKNNKVQIMASQAKSLQEQLRDAQSERDSIESSIRRITAEPFFNREKGQSTLKRIAELEEKLIEKDKHLRALKEEEHKKSAELSVVKPKVEKLKGEKEYLENENKKLRDKFTTNNNLDEFNVYQTLFKMDPSKYAETMQDFSGRPDAYPIWANMDFLERGQTEQIDPNNVKQLKVEILRLKHENKDFAAELEKAQNLLQLQRDIEKDNSKYYDSEYQRLLLVSKSASMKAEELARRADEKQRQLQEMSRKMGLTEGRSRSQSPVKTQNQSVINKSMGDIYETQSEFSAMTNESEMRTDENVLDLVIQDAEYYFDGFKQVLDERELTLHQKTLITFATVDFYNHDTETSQIAEGYKPLYNTQFSFKNKVDDFYVQYLQKSTMKIDVYISKNNSAIHLGRGEIFLREVIERETAMQEISYKTPVIQKTIRLFAPNKNNANQETPIGSLRFKLRLRKSISEAIRFYREKADIANLAATQSNMDNGGIDARGRKKLITIQIVGGKEIKAKYSQMSTIAPFFYYQFYNFDERYSATAAGDNPVFEDTQNYEVQFDAKLINYLQKEPLEVILFDDNAPVTGVSRGGKADQEQVDDMIGTVKVPLADLIKGASIHERYPIRNVKNENCGQVEVKITIIDIDSEFYSQSQKHLYQKSASLHYNKQWENELVYRIAKKIAKFPGEPELLFGIFSRGQKTVTKEDFKYTCLSRLHLKTEVSDREMDMFLRGCPQLLDKQIMDMEDFLMIFSGFITQARHDMHDEEAVQQQTIRRFEEMQQTQQMHQRSFSGSQQFGGTQRSQTDNYSRQGSLAQNNLNQSRTSLAEQEIIEILQKTKFGNPTSLRDKVRLMSQSGMWIQSADLVGCLTMEGHLSEFEARKVAKFMEVNNRVSVNKFEDYLNQALEIQEGSPLLTRFIQLIQSDRAESLVQILISKDYNKDGQLNVDGFKAALLEPDFGFKPFQVDELFPIVQRNGLFFYRDFVMTHNSLMRSMFFSRTSTTSVFQRSETPVIPSHRLNDSLVQLDTRSDHSPHQQPVFEDTRMRMIKNKLRNFITLNDITLHSLFKVIDTNSDEVLTLPEFIQKMKALQIDLDDSELQMLFKVMDKNGAGTINQRAFNFEFPEINISYMIKKIKTIIIGAKVDIEMLFKEFCSDKEQKKMNVQDFRKFVKKYIDKAADNETDSLFRHFTQDLKPYLTIEDFTESFGREVKEQVFKIGIEDIIKPLATKIKAFNVNMSQLFDKYDINKNGRISAEELSRALKNDMNLQLQDDEIQTIKDYFKARHKTTEIAKLDFIELLNQKFMNKCDQEEAKKSLQIVKQKLQTLNKTTMQLLAPYDSEKTNNLTLRNFKVAVNSLKVLSQYQIDNLAKFLDKGDDGFISNNEVDVAIRAVAPPLSSTGNFSKSGRISEKWR